MDCDCAAEFIGACACPCSTNLLRHQSWFIITSFKQKLIISVVLDIFTCVQSLGFPILMKICSSSCFSPNTILVINWQGLNQRFARSMPLRIMQRDDSGKMTCMPCCDFFKVLPGLPRAG